MRCRLRQRRKINGRQTGDKVSNWLSLANAVDTNDNSYCHLANAYENPTTTDTCDLSEFPRWRHMDKLALFRTRLILL